MEQRKNAYLIYKEAINNIIKHADASKVLIKLYVEHQTIWIIIHDNGCGFDTSQISEGNGLRNFIERAETNEMHFNIVSVKEAGTTITLGIPMM
jgi:signal transduction histidine kinase